MRKLSTCLAAILTMAVAHPHVPAAAAAGGVSVAIVQTPGGAIVQTGAGAAVAELGTVSAHVRHSTNGVAIAARSASYVVVTAIGLRATSTVTSEPVSLQAFLESPIPGVHVRVDGIELTSNPITFASGVPLGVITRHRLEIEIPNGMDPGSIPQDIPLEFGATPQ
jgi:hypothetical protein